MIRRALIDRICHILPRFGLPSRRDKTWVFLRKSVPYVVIGILSFLVAIFVLGLREFPWIWLQNMMDFPNVLQIVVYGSVTIVFLLFLAYSIGVLLIEVVCFWCCKLLSHLVPSSR